MPGTVEEVARQVLAAVDLSTGHLLAAQWVSNRYRQLASRARLRHLREVGEIVLPAEITAGLATAARGSKTVTGNAAAQAAWSPAVVGRHIRFKTAWYEIAAHQPTGGGELRLVSDYAEDGVTAGAYRLVQRWTALSDRVRWLGSFVHTRRRKPVDTISLAELDLIAPERTFAGSAGPHVWAQVGHAPSGAIRVEFYPYAKDSEYLHFVFWSRPPELKHGDQLPAGIDPYVLREGALIDAMRYRAAQAANAGQIEVAAYWRNEYRSQATSWEGQVLEAIRADKGVDDVSLILQRSATREVVRDIVTARDEVFSRPL